MSQRVSFTKTVIERVPTPAKGRTTVHDTHVAGLVLSVTATGAKSFYVRRKVRGRSERFFLGRFPDLTVEQARNQARAVIGKVACGLDPESIRKPRSKEHAFGAAFLLYLETYAKLHKRSWREDQAQYRRYLAPWHSRRLVSITKADVVRLHSDVGRESGPYAANRVLALISKLYAFWESVGLHVGINPAKGVRKFAEQARRRFLDADELRKLFDALRDEKSDAFRDFVRIALFTGQRRSNVCAMRWEEIDFVTAKWTIPMTKNGTPHTVPLPDQCLDILQERLRSRSSAFVFPGPGRSGHLIEPKTAWKRLLARAGLTDLRIHDLRHTLASWQAGLGVSLPIIAKTLNHASTAVTQRYAHLHTDVVRNAMSEAVDAMIAAGIPTQTLSNDEAKVEKTTDTGAESDSSSTDTWAVSSTRAGDRGGRSRAHDGRRPQRLREAVDRRRVAGAGGAAAGHDRVSSSARASVPGD